ncbi:hypothetical protein MmiEs2_07400 [Methanimicrococcus stummii]|uniref:Uncharacterized protein n=1 Tax=Methanimicrococcus stummii TaxID=3028294 RepID=A0AA96VLL8_9EURY|nr:hypothetical protein MmiEs2_07400 [Methanimicrococcus sp. Es2]
MRFLNIKSLFGKIEGKESGVDLSDLIAMDVKLNHIH